MTELIVNRDSIGTLVAQAQAGDRGAFDALVESFEDRLREFIRSRMGPRVQGRLELEDVLQETLVRAFQSIAHFRWRDELRFFGWLKSIAENRIRDAVKGPRGDDVIQLSTEIAGTGSSPSKHLRRSERFDRLEHCLARLSPDHRQVILLCRIEGLKTKEVARRMNRSESAVKNLLLRGLRELKSSFGDTESLHLPDKRLGSGGPHGIER